MAMKSNPKGPKLPKPGEKVYPKPRPVQPGKGNSKIKKGM